MTQTNEITVVDCDDWTGLYVNGELNLEGHGRGRIADVLAWSQQFAPATVRLVFPTSEYTQTLETIGCLPKDLSEVEIDIEELGRPELAAQ